MNATVEQDTDSDTGSEEVLAVIEKLSGKHFARAEVQTPGQVYRAVEAAAVLRKDEVVVGKNAAVVAGQVG